jgi:cation diffusion facilitator family transporter
MLTSSHRAVRISLAIIIGLLVVKIAAGAITGSVSILAQAADSFFELSAAIISFIVVRFAVKPADAEHPFGHGKVETVASVVQALVIFIIGALVIFGSIDRIVNGSIIKFHLVGIAVMLLSLLISLFLSRYLHQVARENNSPNLEKSARTASAGIYTALLVLSGLIATYITHRPIIDLILSLVISVWIFILGVDVLRKSSPALIDTRLPPEEEEIISSTIMEHCFQLVGFHNLRTRKSGFQRYIDLHLVVPKTENIAEAHAITEHLEADIRRKLPHTSMIIHIEPCEGECDPCKVPCNLKKTIIT